MGAQRLRRWGCVRRLHARRLHTHPDALTTGFRSCQVAIVRGGARARSGGSGSGVQHIVVHTNSRPHLRRIGKWAGRTQRKTKGARLGAGVRAGARVEAGAGAEVEAEGARWGVPRPTWVVPRSKTRPARSEQGARERGSILLMFVAQEHNETRRHRTGHTHRRWHRRRWRRV